MSLQRELAVHFARSHPLEAAMALERIDAEAAVAVVLDLDIEAAYSVLAAMAPQAASGILAQIPEARTAELLQAAPLKHAVWLVRRLADARQAVVLDGLEPGRSRAMRRALTAREGTAGALVDPDVTALRAEMIVKDALERYADHLIGASDSVPVVDDDHCLVGMVRLDVLQRSPRGQTIRAIMKPATSVVRSHVERRGIVAHPGWQDASALPVVDNRGVLLGMLSYQDYRSLEKALRQAPLSASVSTTRALGSLYGIAIGGAFEALVLIAEGGAQE